MLQPRAWMIFRTANFQVLTAKREANSGSSQSSYAWCSWLVEKWVSALLAISKALELAIAFMVEREEFLL
jgi:hypothetical protein